MKETDVDELCKEIYDRTTNDIDFATQNFVTRIEKYFSTGNGYYDWNSLRYFFYEYEAMFLLFYTQLAIIRIA